MRGIVSAAAYLPHRRLQRSAITETMGKGGGGGTRSVAGPDEDTTTLAVEAGRLARRAADGAVDPDALWFTTATPAYADKTNATAVHAALRLDGSTLAIDVGGAIRSGIGTLRAALEGAGVTLATVADLRSGPPGSPSESAGGDGAAAVLVAGAAEADLAAEYLGGASVTDEIFDQWRAPGAPHGRAWEERFAESIYLDLGLEAWNSALKAAELNAPDVDRVVVVGPHARSVGRLPRSLGLAEGVLADNLAGSVGNTGSAQAAVALTALIETAAAGQIVAVISLADGADVLLLRVTDRAEQRRSSQTVAAQIGSAVDVAYPKFLQWRGELRPEPPNRPPPDRVAAPPAHRRRDWKYGFVGSRDRSTGALHLPPARVSFEGDAIDDMDPAPMADVPATVVTFTVDKLAYSLDPPIVFAVLDFDGGGRFPGELTDVDPDDVAIGDRVEMTFRRLTTADGIHNYFWKARPIRGLAVRDEPSGGGVEGSAGVVQRGTGSGPAPHRDEPSGAGDEGSAGVVLGGTG
jgi:3-hydroxy-3-methylglutaryl CoA synthase